MSTTKKHESTNDLSTEVRELRETVSGVHRAIRMDLQFRRTIAMSFLKGTASALGAMAAVVIVMPVIIWVLQTVAWPPLIADIVTKVIHQLQQSNPPSPR